MEAEKIMALYPKDLDNSIYYLFLPSGVDNTNLTLWETYDEDVFIENFKS